MKILTYQQTVKTALAMVVLIVVADSVAAQGADDVGRNWSVLTDSGWAVLNLDFAIPIDPIEFRLLPECPGELVKTRYLTGEFTVFCNEPDRRTLFPYRDGWGTATYEITTNRNGVFLTKRLETTPIPVRAKRVTDTGGDGIIGEWDLHESREPLDSNWRFVAEFPDLGGTLIAEGNYLLRIVDENTLETDNTFGEDHLIIKIEDERTFRVISQFNEREDAVFTGDLILRRINRWIPGVQ